MFGIDTRLLLCYTKYTPTLEGNAMAKKNEFVVSDAATKLLVDEFVAVRARVIKMKKKEEELRTVLLAEMKSKRRRSLDGFLKTITVTPEECSRLNAEKVGRYLTPAQIKRCTDTTPYLKITSRNLE